MEYGLEQCKYEVIEQGFSNIAELAQAEIYYIGLHDSYKNGLNCSRGGDGLGAYGWETLSESDLIQFKSELSNRFTEYNIKKWANTTPEERQRMVAHCSDPATIASRLESLRDYYKSNPEVIEKKSIFFKDYWQKNHSVMADHSRNALKKASALNCKKVLVEMADGTTMCYKSRKDFEQHTGQWLQTILKKTQNNTFHNGYKATYI